VVTLDELPEHRREALLWRFALELDYDGMDDLVRERSQRPCRVARLAGLAAPDSTGLESAAVAVLGDDGRYHLRTGDRLVCATRGRHRAAAGGYPHKQWCYWWVGDTGEYRIQAPPGVAYEPRRHRSRTVSWVVRLTGQTQPLALVAPGERCREEGTWQAWPAHLTVATPLGRVRLVLVEALGDGCHACRWWPGTMVDHDHFTGLVRGLLCVDWCGGERGVVAGPVASSAWQVSEFDSGVLGQGVEPVAGQARPDRFGQP
jgi:hypothetical protein